jgi:glycosyltransferase involved in cell wall biosynthesis
MCAGVPFMPILSVIIPAYNEEQNIEGALDDVLKDVAAVVTDVEIIVVNDGSSDRTAAIVNDVARRDSRIRLLNQVNKGHGPALANGLAQAQGEWLLLLDSDRQVSLGEFAKHWAMTSQYDAILGLRRPRRDPLHRLVISFFMRLLLRVQLGTAVDDAGAPYKLVRRQIWLQTSKMMRDGCWIPSVLLAAHVLQRRDVHAIEVPVLHQERPHGRSTLNLRRLVRFSREGAADIAYYRERMKMTPPVPAK